jgi:dynein light chain roadblock-type
LALSDNSVSGSTGATATATGNESNEGENKSANGNDSANANTIVGDELTFLRIRSKNKEIMIAPDGDFLMVVIQNPNSVSM